MSYRIIHLLLNAGARVEHPRVTTYDPLDLLDCSAWIKEGDSSWSARTRCAEEDIIVARRICERSTCNKGPRNSMLVRFYRERQRGDIADLLLLYKKT